MILTYTGKLDYLENYPKAEQCTIITTAYDQVLEFIAEQDDNVLSYIRFEHIFLLDFRLKCENGDLVMSDWGEPTDTQGHSHDLRVVKHSNLKF